MKNKNILWGCLLMFSACQNVDDAPLMERATFARFYESALAQSGVAAAVLDDGYVMLGNRLTASDTTGLVIRTDNRGAIQWVTEIENIILRDVAVGAGGLYLTGDSINVNPGAEAFADLVVSSVLLYRLTADGQVANRFTMADLGTENLVDYNSSALSFNPMGTLIFLGTHQAAEAQATQRPFVMAVNPTTMDTLWTKSYNSINRDYVNGKSLHTTSDGHLVWTSAILREQQNFSRSYLSIPFVQETSVFRNSSVYGETTDQMLMAGDIQPSSVPELGFGVVGTYAEPNGANSNIFFMRVTSTGNFVAGSERFFDGQLSVGNQPVNPGSSASDDVGAVICATQDGGFVLGGTMLTTPERGNGGKDLILIKVDNFGNPQWNRILGGSGDENIASITETPDGGLLICGSKDEAGLPAIFLLKTDRFGQIID